MNIIGEWFWYNNSLQKTSLFEQYVSATSNRIYEVLRVVNGSALFLEDHFERFVQSCSKLNVQPKLSLNALEKHIKTVINSNNKSICNIRFEVILEENKVSFACYLVPFSYPKPEVYKKGIELCTYAAERPDPHIKQSAVNDKIREAISSLFQAQKVYEVLLVDHEGYISEGSRSNVFFIKNNVLISPPTEGILEGITRKKVIEIAIANQIEVKEELIPLSELKLYSACFITGTSPKILPINRINNIHFPTNNPLVEQIMLEYERLISLATA